MRNYIFSLLAVFALAFMADIQYAKAQAPLLYTGEMGPDTVNAGETLYHYPNGTSFATSRRFKDLGDLEIVMKSDSLSGSTNVAYTLQYAYDVDGTIWYDAATLTGNGASSQYLRNEDTDFAATWWRIKAVGTGTQATKFQTVYAFKKRL